VNRSQLNFLNPEIGLYTKQISKALRPKITNLKSCRLPNDFPYKKTAEKPRSGNNRKQRDVEEIATKHSNKQAFNSQFGAGIELVGGSSMETAIEKSNLIQTNSNLHQNFSVL